MKASEPLILDGPALAAAFQEEIVRRAAALAQQYGRVPGLATILIGNNPASKVYVANKEKTAKACGLETVHHDLPEDVSVEEALKTIHALNRDPRVDGILLQLPIPKHLDMLQLLTAIDPAKDVDGLHPFNQGMLMRGSAAFLPCTPLGIMHLIDCAFDPAGEMKPAPKKDLSWKTAVVLGRSILVGKPVSILLQERNATVTMAHSKTKNIEVVCRSADILVAAVGVPRLVKREWVKEGATVIDVGINRLESGELCGDVDFNEVAPLCHAITPVPKGVGPMTVTMLIENTVLGFERRMMREGPSV